ncbi:hypothetical protein BJX68DRAFT_159433 [Aspergillus pseudodeflectus]|uniref:Uncharacterized protein n=1 Tax=Aspergillus pseudodeflectus TaxID=176178 RepID=A0ABR4JSR8_9EURO
MQEEKAKAVEGREMKKHTKERSATSHCQCVPSHHRAFRSHSSTPVFCVQPIAHATPTFPAQTVANCSQPFSETGSPDGTCHA